MYELNVLQSVYSYNLAHFNEQRLYEKNIFLVYRFTPTNSKKLDKKLDSHEIRKTQRNSSCFLKWLGKQI